MKYYYVYKARKNRKLYPNNWALSSKHEDQQSAEDAAAKLCPKGSEVHSEPGGGLQRAFFGSATGEEWSSMITQADIHRGE